MNDIFNDMDKVIAKFSDDMREMFKNYHREEVKEEVKEEVFPKYGDSYFFVDVDSEISSSEWVGNIFDGSRLRNGNCFKTIAEAEKHRRFLFADAKLRKMADGGFSGYELSLEADRCFFITLKCSDYVSPYRFSSEEKANQAIEEIGEDDLKLIFGIKE